MKLAYYPGLWWLRNSPILAHHEVELPRHVPHVVFQLLSGRQPNTWHERASWLLHR